MDKPYVVFTQRAFNAIVTETIDKHPIETGGILIGYILDNGVWVVIENIPPGYHTIHRQAYFEYDAEFVNYLQNVVATQYEGRLSMQVLGLWHRHPGSMDVFSSTDDETNLLFAKGRRYGAISALVNCDPKMRITMYHVDQHGEYEDIDWYVDNGEMIPDDFVALRFTTEEDLPVFNSRGVVEDTTRREEQVANDDGSDESNTEIIDTIMQADIKSAKGYTPDDAYNDFKKIIRKLVSNGNI
ncbi:MAG TPA: Mov34/MPN/PAD-1 family protein [Candidatus Avimuribaculum pullicola]|nr:Mov34/MPN/PAD-1 family protein [Candidatus Avimuribaculum pullicola]